MNEAIAKVRTFHEQIGAPIAEGPNLLPCEAESAKRASEHLRESLAKLQHMPQQPGDLLSRLCLAMEELAEWSEAHAVGDLVAAADAWGDRLYVLLGDAVATGMPGQDIFAEVHRSNMTKDGCDFTEGKGSKRKKFQRPDMRSAIFHTRR